MSSPDQVRPAVASGFDRRPVDRVALRETLVALAHEYPPALVAEQLTDVERTVFHIALLLERRGSAITLADIGAGIGIFTLGCARVGMRTFLVDDFKDPINLELGESIFHLHRRHGVEILSKDVTREPLGFAAQSLDAVTMFDSVEHLHHSPKRLLHEVMTALKPGGLFLLCGPNAVNLRKRVAVLLGRTNWSNFKDYYDNPVFRGHVREPCVDDLHRIAADLGLRDPIVLGRNWQAHNSGRLQHATTALVDPVLRLRPSLCREIYLFGHKPG